LGLCKQGSFHNRIYDVLGRLDEFLCYTCRTYIPRIILPVILTTAYNLNRANANDQRMGAEE